METVQAVFYIRNFVRNKQWIVYFTDFVGTEIEDDRLSKEPILIHRDEERGSVRES